VLRRDAERLRVADNAASSALRPWERVGARVGEEIVVLDGGVYVWVPPGEFMMGSNDGEDWEKPVHKVQLTRGFWLGKAHGDQRAVLRLLCGDGAGVSW